MPSGDVGATRHWYQVLLGPHLAPLWSHCRPRVRGAVRSPPELTSQRPGRPRVQAGATHVHSQPLHRQVFSGQEGAEPGWGLWGPGALAHRPAPPGRAASSLAVEVAPGSQSMDPQSWHPRTPASSMGPRCPSSAAPLQRALPLQHSCGCSWGVSPGEWVTGGCITRGVLRRGGGVARGVCHRGGGASPGGGGPPGGASPAWRAVHQGGAGSVICSLQERHVGEGWDWVRTTAGSGCALTLPGKQDSLQVAELPFDCTRMCGDMQ